MKEWEEGGRFDEKVGRRKEGEGMRGKKRERVEEGEGRRREE